MTMEVSRLNNRRALHEKRKKNPVRFARRNCWMTIRDHQTDEVELGELDPEVVLEFCFHTWHMEHHLRGNLTIDLLTFFKFLLVDASL